MFDKLITLNYRRGGGGEFFSNYLESFFTKKDFQQNTDFGTENRFEYSGIDIIFRTSLHHYFWYVFSEYPDIEEYIKGELGYPHGPGLPTRKRFDSNKVNSIRQNFNLWIKDRRKEDEIANLKQFILEVSLPSYDTYFQKNDVPYAICNLHYNSTNIYNMPISEFFVGSKNISLVNTIVDEYFYTLLWVYKRLPDLKYYPFKMKSAYAMPKEDMIEYFKFQKQKEYKVFPGELGIEVFDFQYCGVKIDKELSDLLGMKIKLDYDRVKAYGIKNRELILEHFNVDVFKDYSEEYIYSKFEDYVHRIYDKI